MAKKIVLGFSGGLDTTFCVKYLSEEKGYEVHSIIVNTGGFSDEELKKIEAHAWRRHCEATTNEQEEEDKVLAKPLYKEGL